MKTLVIGGSSLLGKYLIQTKPENVDLECTWYTNYVNAPSHQLDVTNKSQVNYVFSLAKPDIVIHCAANGNVDYTEKNYQEVYRVNVDGVANVLRVAKDYSSKVVYISTNAVFSGDNPPYVETDACDPVNAYGRIKRQAERLVTDYRHWLIIRPFLLYGWPNLGGRHNWVTNIISYLRTSSSLKLVNDVIWQPTYAYDCAETIWKLLETDNEIYHVASSERATLYTFGLKVAKIFELNHELIEQVPSSYFPSIAPRPKDTSYDLSKVAGLGLMPLGIENGLERMKDEL